ncbi:hemolysin [Rhodobacterales bacterium HKCCE2091]|nr:hemolysin [Rhodobacterales bacterium HKCCE2091]
MATTWKALYLGNPGFSIDPVEGNAVAGDAGLLVGLTFGSPAEKLADHIVSVTAIDNGGTPDLLDTDGDLATDEIRYDLGSGPVTRAFEATAGYDATITYGDGTTAVISAVLFQDVSGNLFLAPEITENADHLALEAKGIVSITLDALVSNNANLAVDRMATDFLCFASGTLIATPAGPRPVEGLRPGDLLHTLDRGPQPVRWIGSSRQAATGKRAPVRIAAGALGAGLPERDLRLSRQHRVLVRSAIALRMFGTAEVLVPALRLVGLPGIGVEATGAPVGYWHLLLDRHEILMAEGAAVESLLPGPVALEAMSPRTRRALAAVLAPPCAAPATATVRPVPSPARQRRLLARHARNRRPLVDLPAPHPEAVPVGTGC